MPPTDEHDPESAFDAILDRATARLAIDPDLALEVRRELATHLNAAAAEHRQGGLDEERASAEAARDLGDPDALADDLYKANRSRIRLRSWAKWLGRAAVLPALLLAVAALLLPGLVSRAQLHLLATESEPSGASGPGQWYADYIRSGLTPTQRLILDGDQTAASPAAAQHAIVKRFPDDPVYQANYINTLIQDWPIDRHGQVDPKAYATLTAALDRGEKLDSDNAYYGLIRAALWLGRSSTIEFDKGPAYEVSPLVQKRGPARKPKVEHLDALTVTDRAAFARGMAELNQALNKPRLQTGELAMLRRRLDQLPPTTH